MVVVYLEHVLRMYSRYSEIKPIPMDRPIRFLLNTQTKTIDVSKNKTHDEKKERTNERKIKLKKKTKTVKKHCDSEHGVVLAFISVKLA